MVFDAQDHRGLARFYVALTGGEERYADDEWVTTFTGDGWRLGFQAAPDHVAPRWPDQAHPQQMHMDFQVADLAAATARAEELGARTIETGASRTVLADPAGHPFCLCASEQAEPIRTFAVNIDCPDGAPLSEFYAALLGYQVKYQQDKMAWVGTAEPAPMGEILFQPVADYRPPRWPDPAHPQQMHLDFTVTDVDAAESRALELGATRLPGEGDNWRVYADPDGHPFCLVWTV
ncbi:VOC family protein [Longispora fulva]|uniref:Putative enzyme related to lactoylglutathione lyase n=1 Tax=Longispora fulva TaxID=619741 RepID=A0A8J7GGH9_9ACTN|nr:VOC family protein [Longispora fulva]MBG6135638.1 putative enzyme related to lactoylglutathione lyase [Longispora fulva]